MQKILFTASRRILTSKDNVYNNTHRKIKVDTQSSMEGKFMEEFISEKNAVYKYLSKKVL